MNEQTDTKFKAIHLIDDQPVEDLELDHLGLMPWAKMIAGIAVGTRGPFTIGIHGEWGYGKTTLLRLASKLVEQHEDVVTVWFNAWQFEQEKHPLFSLIAAIADEIEKKTTKNENLKKIGFSLRALARGMKFKGEVGMPLMGKVGVEFDADKALQAEELIGKQSDPLQGEMMYHSAFEKLGSITQSEQGVRIVIFVDDLDRCHPNKAVFLLESIKLILAQPGFVFVLAVDRPVIERYLDKRYIAYCGDKEVNRGRSYLEKIIQLPIHIPSHRSRFREYVKRVVDDLADAYKDSPLVETLRAVQSVLATGARTNPRTLVRLVNNFLLDYNLWSHIPREGELKKYEHLKDGVAEALVFNRVLQPILGDLYTDLVYEEELQPLRNAIRDGRFKNYIDELPKEFESDAPGEPRRRSNSPTPHVAVARTLQSYPELITALQEHGWAWLEERNLRVAVYEFAQTQRAEDAAVGMPDVLADAIRNTLGLGPDDSISTDQLSGVDILDLSYKQVSNRELRYMKGLSGLQTLSLISTHVTDAGLEYLKGLSGLQMLSLSYTQVTDAGLEHLKSLSELQTLSLSFTQVTDTGLEHLKDLSELQILYLNNTQVTDAGLEHLKGLSGLQVLYIGGTQVTDAGLERLEGQSGLQELYLNNTQVTDNGLEHLKGLSGLHKLSLTYTQVTDAGVEALRKVIPGIQIIIRM